MAIIYIHGFASSGNSGKVSLLRRHFPDETIVSPDLPVDPDEVEQLVDRLVRELYSSGERKFFFIGTSLGGFYCRYFSAKYDSPALLVNPAVNAATVLANRVGLHKNFQSGQDFEWKQEFLSKLARMQDYAIKNENNRLIEVAVALNDDELDSSVTLQAFEGKVIHAHEDGGHRFDHFEKLVPSIRDRYGKIVENETLL